MALLWIEGFEGFGTSTGVAPSPTDMLSRKYTVANESRMDIETGRDGVGYCLEIYYNADYIQSPNLTTNATCVLGVAIKVESLTAENPLFTLYDGITKGVGVHIETDGTLSIYRGLTLLGTSTNALSVGIWYYLELKVFTNNVSGTAELKVNGASWLSLTSQDTQAGSNAYHTAFRLGILNYAYVSFDDLYFLDASGTINNDFLGNQKVLALDPSAAGDDTDWTPSAGSNYQCVDDGALLDEDTTYNETSTSTDQDLYNYENLPADVNTVNGVQINTEVKVTAGSMDIENVIKTGTTTDVGTAETITSTTYVSSHRVEELDPDTAAAWTPSGVDGAQFGIKAT